MRVIICVLLLLVVKPLQGQPTAPERLSKLDQNLRIQFGPDYPVGLDLKTETPISQRLKDDPNDAFAIRKYAANNYDGVNKKVRTLVSRHAAEGIERITEEVAKILPDAEKSLDDLESFLQSLPAATPAAKAAIAGAEAYLRTSRESLEIQRTSLQVFEKRLFANPGDAMRIGYWRERLQFEFFVLIDIDPFKAANLIANANEVFAVAEKAVAREEKEYSPAWMSPVWQLDITRDTLSTFEKDSQEAVDELHHYFELAGMDALPLCLLYTSPSPRDQRGSRMPSSA